MPPWLVEDLSQLVEPSVENELAHSWNGLKVYSIPCQIADLILIYIFAG